MTIATVMRDSSLGTRRHFSPQEAYRAINRIAYRQAYFTSDDVWKQLEKPDEPRALGQVLVDHPNVEPTMIFRKSKQGTNHGRPVRVWESKVFNRKS